MYTRTTCQQYSSSRHVTITSPRLAHAVCSSVQVQVHPPDGDCSCTRARIPQLGAAHVLLSYPVHLGRLGFLLCAPYRYIYARGEISSLYIALSLFVFTYTYRYIYGNNNIILCSVVGGIYIYIYIRIIIL